MNPQKIRTVAICIFKKDNCILVFEGFDSVKGKPFYRLLGGGIEVGETSQEAIQREILEETGQAIENLQLLGVLSRDNCLHFKTKTGRVNSDFILEQLEVFRTRASVRIETRQAVISSRSTNPLLMSSFRKLECSSIS
jgi:ADP-ribose pyrophosphatase YjhB (NUDIX family)